MRSYGVVANPDPRPISSVVGHGLGAINHILIHRTGSAGEGPVEGSIQQTRSTHVSRFYSRDHVASMTTVRLFSDSARPDALNSIKAGSMKAGHSPAWRGRRRVGPLQ